MPLTTIEVSRKALLHNFNQFKKLTPESTLIMPVIKSNAYGHGLLEVADVLKEHTEYFVVVSTEEAQELREAGIQNKIFILGNVDRGDKEAVAWIIQNEIDVAVYDRDFLEVLNTVGISMKKQARVHVKVDTGMSRFGVHHEKAVEYVPYAQSFPWITLLGIYTHLAVADEPDDFTQRQICLFKNILNKLHEKNITIPLQHIYNTAGMFQKEFFGNAARLGIGLYGSFPSRWIKEKAHKEHPTFVLEPALSWKTKVIQIKQVSLGSSISYGRTHTVKTDTTLALIPVGYSDGYDRRCSNTTEVIIHGTRFPVVGRVCMNQTMVDVSAISDVRVGDTVTLIGTDGSETISVDELAEKISTINYEIVTRINPVLPRVYV